MGRLRFAQQCVQAILLCAFDRDKFMVSNFMQICSATVLLNAQMDAVPQQCELAQLANQRVADTHVANLTWGMDVRDAYGTRSNWTLVLSKQHRYLNTALTGHGTGHAGAVRAAYVDAECFHRPNTHQLMKR
jgi:hypothetical protein